MYHKRFGFFLFILTLISQAVTGQNASLRGSVADTSGYKPMAYSSISLVRKDSVLVRTTFAKRDNHFSFQEIPPDTYLLLVTHPGFADYEEVIQLQPGESRDMGTLYMVTREHLLREVLIKDHAAIRIKGDTTEFLVDSFLVNKDATVEQLLKRLPGIQVSRTGKITAQGQEVKRVLVDGEEFFGNDPTVATKNLKAENVETVQVFDRNSEEARQTGLEDGQKEKTINLTLKEEAKKGSFGKLGGAYGTPNNSNLGNSVQYGSENRYEGEAMANRFRSKQKASVFGNISNTHNMGPDWQEREKYLGGNNIEYNEANGYMYSYYQSDPLDYDGNGMPGGYYSGGYFSDKVNKDKLAYNLLGTARRGTLQKYERDYTQYILPDTMYYVDQRNTERIIRNSQNLTGKTEYEIDTANRFVVRANWKQGDFDRTQEFGSRNLNGAGQLVNQNNRTINSKGKTTDWDYSLKFIHKFEKQGRSVSINWNHQGKEYQTNQYLLSGTSFYKPGGDTLSEQKLDQWKLIQETGQSFTGTISYTEPLSKRFSLISDYSLDQTNNHSSIGVWNRGAGGGYTSRVDSLSNDLNYDISIQRGRMMLQYRTKKINAALGGRLSYTQLEQQHPQADTSFTQRFVNVFPTARFNYKPGTTKNISFEYSGSTQQPTLQQINPIQDLSNPLVVFRGNPNLKQKFSHDFSLSYSSYQAMKDISIYGSISYNEAYNDFSNSDAIDAQGKRVYQTVNVDGNRRVNTYWYYYFKIRPLNLMVGNNLYGNYSVNHGFINGLANVNRNLSSGYDIDLTYEVEEKVAISVGPGINYNQTKSSLRPDVETGYYTWNIEGDIRVFLPKKMEWFAEFTYNVRQRTDVFTNNYNNLLINAHVQRKFLKDQSLSVRLSVRDLLNQNIGFDRNVNSNYVNESTYLVMKRYFMFGLYWQFNTGTPSGE